MSKSKAKEVKEPNPNKKKEKKANRICDLRFLKGLEVGSYIILLLLSLVALELPQPLGQIAQITVLVLLVTMEIYIRSQKKKLQQLIEQNDEAKATETTHKQ